MENVLNIPPNQRETNAGVVKGNKDRGEAYWLKCKYSRMFPLFQFYTMNQDDADADSEGRS